MWEQYILVVLAILFTGFLKLGFAISAGLFLTPIMTAALQPPSLGIAVMSVVLWLTDAEGLRRYWGRWDGRTVVGLLPTAVLGTLLGAYFLARAPAELIRQVVGAIAILFVLYNLLKSRLTVPQSNIPSPIMFILGLAIGFVGAVANAGGMIASLILLYQNTKKESFISTMSILLTTLGALKLFSFFFLGVLTWQQFLPILIFFPLILLGGQLGISVQKRIDQRTFRWVVSGGVLLLSLSLLL